MFALFDLLYILVGRWQSRITVWESRQFLRRSHRAVIICRGNHIIGGLQPPLRNGHHLRISQWHQQQGYCYMGRSRVWT